MKLDVLVGLACSPFLRDACRDLGHNAWTCDIKPAEDGSPFHIQGDVRDQFDKGWHLAILHPVCTRLTNAGARWLIEPPDKLAPWDYPADLVDAYAGWDRERRLAFMWEELQVGADLFSDCLNAPIECRAIENPVMHKHAKAAVDGYFKYAQTVQPWHYATDPDGPDNVKKRTCWWLVNLPKLQPTGTLDGSTARPEVHFAAPGPDRATFRSRSHPGMMQAAADQWCRAAELHHSTLI